MHHYAFNRLFIMPPSTFSCLQLPLYASAPKARQLTRIPPGVMAMQAFKATRKWPEVFAQWAQFVAIHPDPAIYSNPDGSSIRDRLSRVRERLIEMEARHDGLAAQLLSVCCFVGEYHTKEHWLISSSRTSPKAIENCSRSRASCSLYACLLVNLVRYII